MAMDANFQRSNLAQVYKQSTHNALLEHISIGRIGDYRANDLCVSILREKLGR